ncbi:MAG: exodeoxyribonuclease VII large subunit [Gammaproteobacteria bacterium]|nr:exodeoxyribonuclease VII large subunit [Gammaproteobacteria bacterium]
MERVIYRVSEFTDQVRRMVESEFSSIWLTGEISNLATPASGHVYFSLKDENAQVRCAMFRNRRIRHAQTLKNGDAVLLCGAASIYAPRGDFQLIVDYIEPAGEGELRRRFELLKERLQANGFFDPANRKPLPELPKCIGLITSPSGAALHDISVTLARRFPLADVVHYRVAVQGESASPQIAEALATANREGRCDVLILSRGGGSLEDLWAFNEEQVVMAISRSRIPIVSGIGHETDLTLADFAADLRAATPTAAAEAVTPNTQELAGNLSNQMNRMRDVVLFELRIRAQTIDSTARRLRHPRDQLRQQLTQVQRIAQRLRENQSSQLQHSQSELQNLILRLKHNSPMRTIKDVSRDLSWRKQEIKRHASLRAREHSLQISRLDEKLKALSPLATLDRGFAIITSDQDGDIVRSSEQLSPGQTVTARFARGEAVARVERLKEKPDRH